MPLEKFKAAMVKLCHPQSGILKKRNPKNSNFVDDESISINESFSSAKIKINFIPIKSVKKKIAEPTSEELK